NIKKLAEAVAYDVSVDPEVEIPLNVSHSITTVGSKQEVVFTTPFTVVNTTSCLLPTVVML
ncbi:hypothetical protein PT113_09255, partial [Erysipelothrix rhusiopathiae]|nr:hypothetical protein [Erysipelothrix rhusiopathiae]